MLLSCLIILFALITISSQTFDAKNDTLTAHHIAFMKRYNHEDMQQGSHSFLVLSAMRQDGLRTYPASLYLTTTAFCAYTEIPEGTVYLYSPYHKDDTALTCDTVYHITCGTRMYDIECFTAFPINNKGKTGCTVHVKSNLPNNNKATNLILGFTPFLHDAFLQFDTDMAPSVLYRMQIGLTLVLTECGARGSLVNTGRAIVTQNFSFYVTAGDVEQYGDGTVINFHLWVNSGSGAFRHEIMAGYLVLTGITGAWKGTGIIYMNHP